MIKNNYSLILLFSSCLLVYIYLIIAIVVSHAINYEIATHVYIISLFPSVYGMICIFYNYLYGVCLLVFIYFGKYLFLLMGNGLPGYGFIYIIVDTILQLFFILVAFYNFNQYEIVIKRKVIPIKTTTYEVCSICLEPMNSKLVETVCKHIFHESCLSKWNKVNIACPLCRNDL